MARKNRRGRAEMPDHSTPAPGMCLMCGYFFEAASSITGKKESPEKGDFTMCLNCGAIHRFTATLGLVLSSVDAVRDNVSPELLHKVLRGQQFIRMRGKIDAPKGRSS